MTIITECARAKVNLTLKVLGRRPDGYHELESLVVFAGIGDELQFDTTKPPGIDVSGPFARAIEGGSLIGENLIDKALRAALRHGPKLRLCHISLDKLLPVAAGIGGGSADAAAALRGIARANPELADGLDWPGIAAEVGADVTVCLRSRGAMMWGTGKYVDDVEHLPRLAAVLVNPGLPLSTAAVFHALRAAPCQPHGGLPLAPGHCKDIDELLSYLRAGTNDLEATALALAPPIGEAQAALKSASGCALVRLSGSGPTSFGLFGDDAGARNAARAIAINQPDWWVAATSLS